MSGACPGPCVRGWSGTCRVKTVGQAGMQGQQWESDDGATRAIPLTPQLEHPHKGLCWFS